MFEQTTVSLSVLAQDAHNLSAAEFEQRYGASFLVHAGTLDTGMSPLLRTLTDRDNMAAWGGGEALQVFLVRPKASNVFPDFISIGRAANNDVVITHPSVSKFHAYLRRQPEGLRLYDAASANGTFSDNDRVAVKGRGAPTILTSGVSLRFGMVDVMFLGVEQLRGLAQTLVQQLPPAASSPLVANSR